MSGVVNVGGGECRGGECRTIGNGYLEQILEMKKQKGDHEEKENVRGEREEEVSFEFKASTPPEMLSKILLEATPDEVYLEYLWFVRNLPTLINNQRSDLLHLVKTELGVARVKESLCGKVNFTGSNFPILDALSCKVGIHLRNIIAPPTSTCHLCHKPLTKNQAPCHVPLHTTKS